MSTPIAPPVERKTFTPAIITALVALVVLAVITVVVVSRNSSDSTTASSSAASAAPSVDGVPSDDGSFTYLPPPDFEVSTGADTVIVYLTNAAVIPTMGSDNWTTLSAYTVSTRDQSLEEFTAQTRENNLTGYDGVEITTPLVADIDGEKTSGITIPAYVSVSRSVAQDKILTVRNGIGYTFTVAYPAESQESARRAFTEFVNSVRWSD